MFSSAPVAPLSALTVLGLRYTAVWNQSMAQSDDFKEALLSGVRKTKPKPRFEKL